MSRLLYLLDFIINSSGYSLIGISSHLAELLLLPINNLKDIETIVSLDYYALRNL